MTSHAELVGKALDALATAERYMHTLNMLERDYVAWLTNNKMDPRLLKPALDGDGRVVRLRGDRDHFLKLAATYAAVAAVTEDR